MNDWLVANTRLDPRDPYISSVYVKGDFTASHKEALELFRIYKQEKEEYDKTKAPDDKDYFNKHYCFITNNCSQVTMRLFFQGTLPDGTNVGEYAAASGLGYGIGILPDANMENMQKIFYNSATNLDGFNEAIQAQRSKYEGKNTFVQWWYAELIKNINTIA